MTVKVAGLLMLAGGLSQVGEVATSIAAIAAALAGLAWIYGRIMRPVAGAALRTYRAVEALEELPAFMQETRERLDQGSENFRLLNERVSLAERAAFSVAETSAMAAEHTQALVRELDVPSRGAHLSDT